MIMGLLREFFTYLDSGGIINSVIAIVGCVAFYLGFGRVIYYFSYRRRRESLKRFLSVNQMVKDTAARRSEDWFLDYFISIFNANPERSVKYYQNLLREKLMEKIPEIEDGLDQMAAWVSVAPLLGLLGTVIGMVETFRIITAFGIGNPNLLSEGISIALLTTQSGLMVAFPCMLFHNFLLSHKNKMIRELIADGEQLLNWVSSKQNKE